MATYYYISQHVFCFVSQPLNRLHFADPGQLVIPVSSASQKCSIVIGLAVNAADVLSCLSLTQISDVDQMTARAIAITYRVFVNR